MVEISTNETGNPQMVYSSSLLDPGTTSLNTEYSLSPGEYFWIVVIDHLITIKCNTTIFVVQ
jgi:hypothetical protein